MNDEKGYVQNRSKEFAIRIVKCCEFLVREHGEHIMSKQLLRAGTSIGANIAEAEFAQSSADFYSKLSISLKESSETRYWLELLYSTQYLSKEQFESMLEDINIIISILVKIVKNKDCEKHSIIGNFTE